jgi:hypothetical protein
MRGRLAALVVFAALVALAAAGGAALAQPVPLAEDRIEITGVALPVAPAYQAVPRNTATIVSALFARSGGGAGALPALPADAIVRAELRGPALAAPLALSARPGEPLEIPPLALAGVYTLDGIALVAGGETLLVGSPAAARIEVVERVLVSEVSARALSAEEIRDKGIFVDETSFQVVSFTANLGIEDRKVRVDFPMLIPIAPGPEAPPAVPALVLPALAPAQIPEARLPGLDLAFQTPNVSVSGLLLRVEESDEDLRGLAIPPLPAVVVIPGNVAFLNQFFSVMLMASNAAPKGSRLELRDLEAEIRLPAGRDTTPATADDPLRMARLGTPPAPQPVQQPVLQVGPDGERGTADDVLALAPGASGDAEFLVEGLREGGHTVEIEIRGMLHGLPVGPVAVSGRALGLVEVRNPSFALTLSHPAAISAGEEYDLLVTVTNTSETVANFVSVNLLPNSVSGARLVSAETQEVETLAPGEAATVSFRLRAQVTGEVVATSLTSDGIPGRFELRTAVGALGIPLSPNSLVLPRAADALPRALREAAIGFLGQALALATAPVVPKGLSPVSPAAVLARARDVAAAGQRVELGESVASVARDLLLAFAGSDAGRLDEDFPDDAAARARAEADLRGLDELLRRSERGRALVGALADLLADELAAQGGGAFQEEWAALATSLPPPMAVLATPRAGPVPALRVTDPAGRALGAAAASAIPFGVGARLGEASLALLAAPGAGPHVVELVAGEAGRFDLGLLVEGSDALRSVRFEDVLLAAGGRARLVVTPGDGAALALALDADGDGDFEAQREADSDVLVADPGPALLTATQIVSADPGDRSRIGNLIGLLFSEEVSADSAQSGLGGHALTHYAVDANAVVAAQLQPGGRVVLLALREGIGPYVSREVSVSGVEDLRGNLLDPSPSVRPIATRVAGGGRMSGLVRRGDGTPVPFAALLLSLRDDASEGVEVALVSKQAGPDGSFGFDFVPDGLAHLEAVDVETGERGELWTELRRPDARLDVVLLGTGTLAGRALAADAQTPLAGAVVVATSLTRLGEQHGAVSGADGSYLIAGIPVGSFTVEAVHAESRARVVRSLALPAAGGALVEDLVLLPIAAPSFPMGALRGQVFRSDGATPAAGIPVYTDRGGFATTDSGGAWRIEGLPAGPARVRAVDQAALAEGSVATTVVAGAEITANLLLQGGTGRVRGALFDADGRTPIEGALVGGGQSLVRTGADGGFELADVPVGPRTIRAVDEASGRAAQADVVVAVPGEVVDVRLLLEARADLVGTVRDAEGSPVADLEVFVLGPRNLSTVTDAAGAYRFDDLPLGPYRVSAFLEDFSDGNVVTTQLAFADELRRADVTFRGRGRVRGLLLNDSGNPLGGGVVGLSELKPKLGLLRPPENTNCLEDVQVGDVTVDLPECKSVAIGFERIQLSRTTTSDVVDGSFAFEDVLVGAFDLEAGDRFSGDVVRADGAIPAHAETVDVLLRFPANAREIAGTVYQPGGDVPAGAGVAVCLPACGAPGGIEVRTDADGRYRMQFPFVSGAVTLEAQDDSPIPPLRGQAQAAVDRGASAEVPIVLLGHGRVEVSVAGAAGPVASAAVELRRGTFPGDVHTGQAGPDGRLVFDGGDAVSEGRFSVSAFDPASGARGFASGEIEGPGAAVAVEVVLPNAAGAVEGRFLLPDGAPIPNAQVRLSAGRGDAFSVTGPDGRYAFAGVPIGALSVEAFDPRTARRGQAHGSLFANGQTIALDVVAVAQGTVLGRVVRSGARDPVAGAEVTLGVASVFGQSLRSTSQADGSFRFPGVSAGSFTLGARDAQGLTASAQGRIDAEGDVAEVELLIEAPALGRIEGFVREADGGAPPAAEVLLDSARRTTPDGDGFYFFDDVPLGSHGLRASQPGSPDAAVGTASVAFDGETVRSDLAFVGTGSLRGTVRDGAGEAVGFARVSLSARSAAGTFASDARTADADGGFAFALVPVGEVALTARDDRTGLAGTAAGRIDAPEQALVLDVALEPAAALGGRVVREDGAPAGAIALELVAGGLRRFGSTAPDGTFLFEDVAIRPVVLRATDPLGDGIAALALDDLAANETRDVGDLVLDESPPEVLATLPGDGATGVPVAAVLAVIFSEPVDPSSVGDTSVRVATASGPVAGALLLADGDSRVEFVPDSPFRDFERVTLRVTTGVRDRAGRALAAERVTTFTTADSTPPAVVGRSPAPGAAAIGLDSVIRIAFSERVDVAAFAGPAIELRRGGSLVPARLDFALGDTVAILTPDAPLAPNTSYDVALRPATDVFGNVQAAGESFAFDTLDTVAPRVCALAAPGGTSVRAGTTALVVADAACEPDTVAVEFFVAGAPAGSDGAAPFELRFPVSGEAGGAIDVSARARDAAGNVGAAAGLRLTIEADAPPTLVIEAPAEGSEVASGATVRISATARDDVGLARVAFQASGAANASRTLVFASPVPSVPVSFDVPVPPDAAPGAEISVRGAAFDVPGQSSAEASLRLRVRDASGPAVAIVAPAPGSEVRPGESVDVRVRASDPSGVVEIGLGASGAAGASLAQAIEPAASPAELVFRIDVPASARAHQVLRLAPSARDGVGNAAAGPAIELRIADLDAPAVSVRTMSGAFAFEPGASVEILVQASDLGLVGALGIEVDGAPQAPRVVEPPASQAAARFTVEIPGDTPLSTTLEVIGTAVDRAGNASRSAPLLLRVADLTAPDLAILAPADGSEIEPGAAVVVSIEARDALGVTEVFFFASGAAALEEGRVFDPPAPLASPSFAVAIPPDAAPGATLAVVVYARDAGSNESAQRTLALRVADRVGPSVVSVEPPDGATGVAETAVVRVTFSEPIDPASLGPASLAFFPDGAGRIPADVTLIDGGRTLQIVPRSALALLTLYHLQVGTGVRDLAGNALVTPLASRFTTRGADTRGPQLLQLNPSDGATESPLSPWIAARFDEPLARASVPPNGLELVQGGRRVEATLDYEDGDRTLLLRLAAPLALDTAYTVELNGNVTDAAGNRVVDEEGQPFDYRSHTFTTGAFAIAAPADGSSVPELAPLRLEARASAGLGVASVVFSLGGVELPAVGGPPFSALATTPASAGGLSLSIEASGRNAAGVEIARSSVVVQVRPTLRFEPALLGVPIGGAARARLVLSSALASDLEVLLAARTAGVVALSPRVVIEAGALAREIQIQGLAEGSVGVRATSALGEAAAIAAVSAPVAGRDLAIAAAPVGLAVDGARERERLAVSSSVGATLAAARSAGSVALAPGGEGVFEVLFLAAPAGQQLLVLAETSDATVAEILGPVVVRAGERTAELRLRAGAEGVAVIRLFAEDEMVELRVVVGAPAQGGLAAIASRAVGVGVVGPRPEGEDRLAVAAPVGVGVAEPSASEARLTPGVRRVLRVVLLPGPAQNDAGVELISSDESIARVVNAPIVRAGERTADIEIETGSTPGTAALRVLAVGDDRVLLNELRVVAGEPPGVPERAIPSPSVGLGIEISEP